MEVAKEAGQEDAFQEILKENKPFQYKIYKLKMF